MPRDISCDQITLSCGGDPVSASRLRTRFPCVPASSRFRDAGPFAGTKVDER